MHLSALISGNTFAEIYGKPGMTVVDVGGMDVNGSLRDGFTTRGMNFISVDLDAHPSVDIVIKPGDPLPFETGSVDLVVSTSCFEHDPCFWLTFKEMCRIVKNGGYIYVNAPSNGPYHGHPGDNWRFYKDAGQALAYWASLGKEDVYPVKVVESFNFGVPSTDIWNDFICIWKRVDEKTTSIVLENNNPATPLRQAIRAKGYVC